MTAQAAPADAQQAQFLSELMEHGLLLPSGVPGVYGHGAVFEDVRGRLDERLSAEAAALGAERLRFPPVLPRRQLENSGYLSSFPHLAGTVYSFDGDRAAGSRAERAGGSPRGLGRVPGDDRADADAGGLLPGVSRDRRSWAPASGRAFVDAGGAWVFRHEPSHDPARRQIFHQHELVRIAEPERVLQWRDEWAQRGLALLTRFGLDARLDTANDPFFGRRGRMLAADQRGERLKLELLVPIAGPEPSACASFNHHREHFAGTYGLTLADGGIAHTACLGFGHERIVLALLRRHGLDPGAWPDAVRAELWRDAAR